MLLAREVTGFLQLSQVRDQVAGREPDHLLQAREGQRIAFGERRKGGHDLQACGDVDQRVERLRSCPVSRPCSTVA